MTFFLSFFFFRIRDFFFAFVRNDPYDCFRLHSDTVYTDAPSRRQSPGSLLLQGAPSPFSLHKSTQVKYQLYFACISSFWLLRVSCFFLRVTSGRRPHSTLTLALTLTQAKAPTRARLRCVFFGTSKKILRTTSKIETCGGFYLVCFMG